MEKFSKIASPPCPEYVTYYHHSKHVSCSFGVRFEKDGSIGACTSMEKMINPDGNWTVNNEPGNITKEEFIETLNETIKFLKKDL